MQKVKTGKPFVKVKENIKCGCIAQYEFLLKSKSRWTVT